MLARAWAFCGLLLVLSCKFEGDFSGSIQTETLDADAYQKEIVAIDSLMFSEDALNKPGTTALAALLEGLAVRVKNAKESKFLTLESLELQALAKRVKRLPEDRTAAPFRNDWMRIRNNLFDDRAWFARSPADLDYAASVTSKPKTVAPAAAPPPAPEPAMSAPSPAGLESRSTLTGAWRVTSMLANGNPTSDDELTGSRWQFDAPRLMVTDAKGVVTEYSYELTADEIRIRSGPHVGAEGGWMRYRIQEGVLTIAFYDDLAQRPSGFEQQPGVHDPLLLVLGLRAEP